MGLAVVPDMTAEEDCRMAVVVVHCMFVLEVGACN